MLGIMRAGSRRRHEERVARAKACIAGGCKCYCHAPSKDMSMWGVFGVLFVFGFVWIGFWSLMSWEMQRENAAHPPEPYVCNSITSTGAPTDCHPAVLPPDVLKKYEEQFKK
jgi:hypothetical protein